MIPARQRNATQLLGLALAVLQYYEPLRHIAHQFQVSRKFLYSLEGKAFQALDVSFSKAVDGQRYSTSFLHACKQEARFADLVRDLTTLSNWMMGDVLCLEGPDLDTCRGLYDFIAEKLKKLESSHGHRIREVRVKRSRHREDLPAFAQQLEEEFGALAQGYHIARSLVIKMARLQKRSPHGLAYHQRAKPLRNILKHRFYEIECQVKAILAGVVRSSSVVENYNSRLRGSFTLRKEIGKGYLELLRFYLNQAPFLGSQRVEREGKTSKEILTGEDPVHRLELLGYQRFQRAA